MECLNCNIEIKNCDKYFCDSCNNKLSIEQKEALISEILYKEFSEL